MKKIIIVAAVAALMLGSCSSKPQYDHDTVVSLLEKQAGWTAEEYAEMFRQLQATQEKLQEGNLPESESEFLLVANSDMNFYLVEALNDNLLDDKTKEALLDWLNNNL